MNKNESYENVSNIERYLRKIDYIIRKKGRAILADFNITVPQFSALQILINQGNMTIGELSQHMALACSTITDLVDRMEKADLVVRKKHDKDKRVVIVEALPKGYDILEKVMSKRIEFLSGKLSDFEDDAKSRLDLGLKALYEAMKDETQD
ncbi:MarR family transcriptional regulator [Tissierella pigra]|uniref:MarR family transcriptional regulator n=1 Tax=Tissierella pigra TaxID=2607614 RepID=A0A6N7XM61_9FIRM|nr:MarR family transcriptional regulator [Tissierella pigra]MBU5426394.1 MarR family transcriptional regulator [Tissierella pigra]MSU03139.1 MarR family transcriptional regulator [Tissierella pigra]